MALQADIISAAALNNVANDQTNNAVTHIHINHPPFPSSVQNSPRRLASTTRKPLSECASDVYARILLVKKTGYPLWIPEPTNPAEYQFEGVRIGDVGKITYDGSFSFLFNICLPPEDPINCFAPPNLEPIKINRGRDVMTLPNLHPRGVVITSSSITEVTESEVGLQNGGTPPVDQGRFRFSCSLGEGALLVLPDSATRIDYQFPDNFMEYAKRHVQSWYQYVNGTLGSRAHNGSLYLVTGADKLLIYRQLVTTDENALVLRYVFSQYRTVADRLKSLILLQRNLQTSLQRANPLRAYHSFLPFFRKWSEPSREPNDEDVTVEEFPNLGENPGATVVSPHISEQDLIIAMIGPVGFGKSSFINIATGTSDAIVSDRLEACTPRTSAVSCLHADGSGRRVVFIDTPGFDDTCTTIADVLTSVENWLTETYKSDKTFYIVTKECVNVIMTAFRKSSLTVERSARVEFVYSGTVQSVRVEYKYKCDEKSRCISGGWMQC